MKRKRKGTRAAALLTVVILMMGSWFCSYREAEAYEDVTSLEVTVGFWGMQEYTKKVTDLSKLADECGLHYEIYTWIDNKPSAGTTEAKGIYLSDLMEYHDINRSAVRSYNFFTLDAGGYDGAHEQWTPENLFGTRYTFRANFERITEEFVGADLEDYDANPENYYHLSDFYNESEIRGSASYTQDAWNERQTVEPMLALETKSHRWEGLYPSSYLDFSDISSSGNPQLLYGQKSLEDSGRSNMAKMVYKIHVWYAGSPTITTNVTELTGEIGDTEKITVHVTTPDSFLTQAIAADLIWHSDNEDVAVVDENGNVTFVGEGEASIRISYGDTLMASVGISSSGSGSGSGNGDGDGSGDETGGGEDGPGSGDETGGGENGSENGNETGGGENGSENGNETGNEGNNFENGNETGNEENSSENGNETGNEGNNSINGINHETNHDPENQFRPEDENSENQVSIRDNTASEKTDSATIDSNSEIVLIKDSNLLAEAGGNSGSSGGKKFYEYDGSLGSSETLLQPPPAESTKWIYAAVILMVLCGVIWEALRFKVQINGTVSEADFSKQILKHTPRRQAPDFSILIPKPVRIALLVLMIAAAGIGGRLAFGPAVLWADISSYEDEAILITGLLPEDFQVTPGELAELELKKMTASGNSEKAGTVEAVGPTLETFIQSYGEGIQKSDIKQIKFYASDGYSTVLVNTVQEKEIILSIANGRKPLYEEQQPLRIVIAGEDSSSWIRLVTKIEFTLY